MDFLASDDEESGLIHESENALGTVICIRIFLRITNYL